MTKKTDLIKWLEKRTYITQKDTIMATPQGINTIPKGMKFVLKCDAIKAIQITKKSFSDRYSWWYKRVAANLALNERDFFKKAWTRLCKMVDDEKEK